MCQASVVHGQFEVLQYVSEAAWDGIHDDVTKLLFTVIHGTGVTGWNLIVSEIQITHALE